MCDAGGKRQVSDFLLDPYYHAWFLCSRARESRPPKFSVVQIRPTELPAGRVIERLKDDGILDCLLHFAAKGHNVLLCTNDKQFITRAQVASLALFSGSILGFH